MRIHVQNNPKDPVFEITEAVWTKAADLANEGGHTVSYGSSPDELREALMQAEVLVAPVSEVLGRFPAEAPALRMIFCLSAGLDKLAPFDWLPPGVALLNNRGAHGFKAGEYAAMALLMLANGMPRLIASQHAGRWDKLHTSVLAGRRLTIVGLGSLGGAAATAAKRFNLRVTGLRTRPAPHEAAERVLPITALDEVLPESDFLLLSCPLTPQTRGLIDRRRLGLLPSGACVINIGRGALLDQDALCDMLDQDHLAGAVLDVFVPEPVPPGHRLWTTRNLIMTPHVANDDPGTYNPRSLAILFDNLQAQRAGHRPPNQIDLNRHY